MKTKQITVGHLLSLGEDYMMQFQWKAEAAQQSWEDTVWVTPLFRCFTAGFRGLSLTCHWERPLMAGAIKASMFFSCWCSMCVWDRITLVKIWVIRNHLGNGGDFFPSGKCWTFFWDNRKITSTLLKWHTALGQSKQSKHPLSTQANEDRAKGKCSLGNYRPKSRPMKPSWDS